MAQQQQEYEYFDEEYIREKQEAQRRQIIEETTKDIDQPRPQPAPERHLFPIGEGDVQPGGPGTPSGGGNLIGPEHPSFHVDRSVERPPHVPPDARFDPYGPPTGDDFEEPQQRGNAPQPPGRGHAFQFPRGPPPPGGAPFFR